jgi:hypothetical protein
VAAAAIGCQPSTLATWNLKDFDSAELNANGVYVTDPDTFLCECFDADPEYVHAATVKAYGFARGKTSQTTWAEYVDRIGSVGSPNCLRAFADRLRKLVWDDAIVNDAGIDP